MTVSAVTNSAVATAKDLPGLVSKLQVVDPSLAQQIEGKALVASKTPWGVAGAYVVATLAGKYGLGWDASTDALVSGLVVFGASYAMRYVTTSPISGWFHKTPVAAAPPPASVATLAVTK